MEWLADVITWVIVVIAFFVLRGQLTALQTTVQTQQLSLDAQSRVIQGFEALVHALDVTEWPKRYEAYKKLTDREAEAVITAIRRDAEEQQRQAAKERRKVEAREDIFLIAYGASLRLALDLLPYAPIAARLAAIDRAVLPESIKNIVREAARTAPPPEPTLREILAAMPAAPPGPVLPPPGAMRPAGPARAAGPAGPGS